MTDFELVTILFSLLALYLSWDANIQARTGVVERKLLLHGKLRMLRAFTHQFLLSSNVVTERPAIYSYGRTDKVEHHISFHPEAWERFGINPDEHIEFTIFDVIYNPENLILAGMPARLEKFFKRRTSEDSFGFRQISITPDELKKLRADAELLLRHTDLCMSYLVKQMPFSLKVRMFLNFLKEEIRARRYVNRRKSKH